MQALEKTPADRFQTMKDFAERLADAEAEAAMARTEQRRAVTAARRASAAMRSTAGTGRRTGSEAALGTGATPVPAVAPAGRSRKWWWIGAASAVVLALGGIGGYWLTHRNAKAGSAGAAGDNGPDPTHIAVLYFTPRGGGDSLQYLADGLTEALIHELSSVDGLQVISSNGVQPYRAGTTPMPTVARDLHVGTIVAGRVAESGDKLRVTVSLNNAATATELASRTIERGRGELFALQDELSKEVSVFLRQQLGKEVVLQETRAMTRNVSAWSAYQRALAEARDAAALAATGDTAAAGRRSAITDSLLAVAEQQDRQWAAPVTLRGWLRYRASRLFPSAEPSYHAAQIAQGLEYAGRALALNQRDPDALELRGTLRYWKWLNNLGGTPSASEALFTEAEKDLRASVEANPKQAGAWTTLSHLLLNQSAPAEAKLAAMRAYDADPYLSNANVTIWRLFTTSYQLDDALEAKRWCDEGQRRFSDDYRFAECHLWYYDMKGATPDIPAAWASLEQLTKLSPPGLRPLFRLKGQMRLGIALARAGLADSARHVMERSRGDATVDAGRELAQLEAVGRMIVGDKDEAFKWLSTWLASNPQISVLDPKDNWEFQELSQDPRFAAAFKSNK
jgi:TolB-like protein